MRLRSATGDDRAFLRDLYRAAYEPLARDLFGTWNDAFKQERLEAKLTRLPFRIVLLDEIPVGAACSEDLDGRVVLHDLMILPGFQRQGIGSSVLSLELTRAKALGSILCLHTSSRGHAQAFYQRRGFVETARDADFVYFERAG